MATLNHVMLNGQIAVASASIGDDGEPKALRLLVETVRRKNTIQFLQTGNIEREFPMVYIRDKDQIEKLRFPSPMEEGDMIEVVGTLSTVSKKRSFECKNKDCKMKNHYIGTATYITPTYVTLKETHNTFHIEQISKEQGFGLIKERGEISNLIFLAGRLCSEVHYYNENNRRVCSYQVAVKRKLHIKEDPPQCDADFIWVKSLGNQAEQDAEALHLGSRVLIAGALQARNEQKGSYTIKKICEYCGEENEVLGDTMEIVPYFVEYLEDCKALPSKKYSSFEDEDFLSDEELGLGESEEIDEQNSSEEAFMSEEAAAEEEW